MADVRQKLIEGLLKPREHYLRLAEISKRSAIMEAWVEVEAAASDAYVRLVEAGMKVFMSPRETAAFQRLQSHFRGRLQGLHRIIETPQQSGS